MIYIITEDKNSARDFWEIAAKNHVGDSNYKMVPLVNESAGNTTLDAQVQSIIGKLNSGDILFIAFDNIANTSTFNPANFIRKIEAKCNELGVKFKFTRYYCFEELYLSYDALIEMSDVQKSFYKLLVYVHECINNGDDYYTSDLVNSFIQNSNRNIPNKEHFTNVLLIEATKYLKGHFGILKQAGAFYKQAECLVQSCSDIQNNMSEQQYNNVCKTQCKYNCKMREAKDKIQDIGKKSVIRNWRT